MARTTILVSDISGEPIPEGTGAIVTAKPARGQSRRLDVTTEEFQRIFGMGQPIKHRGRGARAKNAAAEEELAVA